MNSIHTSKDNQPSSINDLHGLLDTMEKAGASWEDRASIAIDYLEARQKESSAPKPLRSEPTATDEELTFEDDPITSEHDASGPEPEASTSEPDANPTRANPSKPRPKRTVLKKPQRPTPRQKPMQQNPNPKSNMKKRDRIGLHTSQRLCCNKLNPSDQALTTRRSPVDDPFPNASSASPNANIDALKSLCSFASLAIFCSTRSNRNLQNIPTPLKLVVNHQGDSAIFCAQ